MLNSPIFKKRAAIIDSGKMVRNGDTKYCLPYRKSESGIERIFVNLYVKHAHLILCYKCRKKFL